MTTKVEMDDDEAALFIQGDGNIELVLPKYDDDDEVPDDHVILSLIGAIFHDEEFREFVWERASEAGEEKDDEDVRH